MKGVTLETKVKQIVAMVFDADPGAIGWSDDFVQTLGADSLGILALADDLEVAFDIRLGDEDFDRLNSVAEIIAMLSERLVL